MKLMKNIILSVLFIALFSNIYGQTAKEIGLSSINIQTAEAHINFLAHDELEGREAGKHGSRIAAQYIISQLKQIGIKPLNNGYLQSFIACRKERQIKARYQVNLDSIERLKKQVHKLLSLNNILGIIEGENTKEYVIVGAHYDHLGIDEDLDGMSIKMYYNSEFEIEKIIQQWMPNITIQNNLELKNKIYSRINDNLTKLLNS